MRPGGGKGKGAGFERLICVELSKWVTNGAQTDCFWRSAMSGGRATIRHRQGIKVRQGGDICAVSSEGFAFVDYWFVECKFVRRLNLESFLLSDQGDIAKFWRVALGQARRDKKEPMIIAKQNNGPILVVTRPGKLAKHTEPQLTSHARYCDVSLFNDMLQGNP